MYIIQNNVVKCYGLDDTPVKYITNNYKIVDGEFHPDMSENIEDATKFETYDEAKAEIDEIVKKLHFPSKNLYLIKEI